MADKNINEMEDENNEQSSPPKNKKTKSEGSIPLILMIGGALGGVIMIIVSVIIGTVIANKLFPPVAPVMMPADEHHDTANDEKHPKDKLNTFPDDYEIDESISLLEDGEWLTFDSCKSQTNVKNNPNKLCIIDVAAIYKPHYVDLLTDKGFLTKSEGKDLHGNPIPPGVNKTSELYKKLQRNVTSALISFIGTHTEEELLYLKGNGQLSDSLKVALKEPFKDIGLIVGKVDVTYFIISKI
ncbi:MAG: hypothetical protein FWG85_08250 [Bacteroidetes bacterium]|nr:hypothetical protein [Bacteroidota bacterium]